jgi:hypothetical protein
MGPESGPEGARKQGHSQKNSRLANPVGVRVDGARYLTDVRFINGGPYPIFATGRDGSSPIT